MTKLLSNELLPYCIRLASKDESIVKKAIMEISDQEYSFITAMLGEFLLQGAKEGRVQATDPVLHKPAVLGSVILNYGSGTTKSTVIAFNFSNTAQEALLPTFGLLAAAFANHLNWGNLVAAGSLARTLWSNLSVLRSPHDDDAIDFLRALSTLRIIQKTEIFDYHPSTDEIIKNSKISQNEAITAIKKLESKKIIKIYQWGDQASDLSHLNNRWQIAS